MTFKHVKFEDSAVMRSLERMAREKGLVPAEPARVKTASAPDLGFPQSATLMENILRLCAGLRHAGFEKHATEVEEKFLAFKQAQTLYETSGEKGEDLVDAAHPKGSHKLEDVDGDDLAVFETILDQHLAHLKMIDKKPTGKLANNNQILDAVKVVLAQGPSEEDKISAELEQLMNQVSGTLDRIKERADPETVFNIRVSGLQEKLRNPTIDNLESVKSNLAWLGRKLDPGSWYQYSTTLGAGGLSKDTWSVVEKLINAAQAGITKGMSLRSKINELSSARILENKKPEVAPTAPAAANPTVTAYQAALNQLDALKERVEGWLMYAVIRKSPVASAWIKEESDTLKGIKEQYGKATPAQQATALAELQSETNAELKDINDFEAKWIKH